MANYWLMKSEPDVFSIDQLKKDKKTLWDGVRNYQARNFMVKEMKMGDRILFYHSNAKPPGVAGLAKISKPAVPDPTQFNKKSEYFDPKSSEENPRWFCVEVSFDKKFKDFVPLEDLRQKKGLEEMLVIKKGQRLSIQPLTKKQFDIVCKMGGL
jgi:predicted RNA-binding protein with PUA-like domain